MARAAALVLAGIEPAVTSAMRAASKIALPSSTAHTLCTADTAYCAAATAVTAMGSPSLALSHLCCGLCERHCSATAGTL